jgi:hypothetical protein
VENGARIIGYFWQIGGRNFEALPRQPERLGVRAGACPGREGAGTDSVCATVTETVDEPRFERFAQDCAGSAAGAKAATRRIATRVSTAVMRKSISSVAQPRIHSSAIRTWQDFVISSHKLPGSACGRCAGGAKLRSNQQDS